MSCSVSGLGLVVNIERFCIGLLATIVNMLRNIRMLPPIYMHTYTHACMCTYVQIHTSCLQV